MEEAESYNWVIYPSKQQKITECALVLVGLLILAPVLSVFALSASAVCFFLFLFILWRQRSVIELQRYPTSWHLRHHSLRSEEHTSELQSRPHLVCRLLLEKKKN